MKLKNKFPVCKKPIGLYPIVDDYSWLEKLLPLGITTMQLRIKDKPLKEIDYQIKQSVQLAKQYDTQLFINDYWELACKHQAYGVHLGQEDLVNADLNHILKAGLHLGISTHCKSEINIALDIQPSYLALGPIFPTDSKPMPFVPQGIYNLNYWRERISYPLVAIGGIDKTNIVNVINCKVDGIAMISAITKANDPIAVTKSFLEILDNSLFE